MKKQILSFVFLAAIVGAATSASADLNQTGVSDNFTSSKISQSDVPDNMLSLTARSAVDVLTDQTPQGPRDECTIAELEDGSCVKQIMSQSNFVNNVSLPKGKVLRVDIRTRECQGNMEATLPSDRRMRIYDGENFNESGRYMFANYSFETCTIQLKVIEEP